MFTGGQIILDVVPSASSGVSAGGTPSATLLKVGLAGSGIPFSIPEPRPMIRPVKAGCAGHRKSVEYSDGR